MAFIKSAKTEKFPRGQSLMETIVAVAILLAAVTAILSLVTNNITGQKESEFQIMANNLAREGIEVARNLRDSNSLAGVDWDAGLVGLPGQKSIAYFDASKNEWRIIFKPVEKTAAGYNEQLYFSADKFYSHDKDSGPLAPFSRYLTLNDICLVLENGEEAIRDKCDALKEKRIGFKVSAVVSWLENKRTRQVVLEELLYAWK